MKTIRYISGVSTLVMNADDCVGCGMCAMVCPHGVLTMNQKKARVVDRDGCMECGACALNCPANAVQVTPGVGCAAYIIQSWIKGKENACCGGGSCC